MEILAKNAEMIPEKVRQFGSVLCRHFCTISKNLRGIQPPPPPPTGGGLPKLYQYVHSGGTGDIKKCYITIDFFFQVKNEQAESQHHI